MEDCNAEFIETIRLNPCLYDPSDPNYRKNSYKEVVWTLISVQFDDTAENCRKKWQGIRKCYYKQILRRRCGMGTTGRAACLEKLSFLDKFITIGDKTLPQANDDECKENVELQHEKPKAKKRKRKTQTSTSTKDSKSIMNRLETNEPAITPEQLNDLDNSTILSINHLIRKFLEKSSDKSISSNDSINSEGESPKDADSVENNSNNNKAVIISSTDDRPQMKISRTVNVQSPITINTATTNSTCTQVAVSSSSKSDIGESTTNTAMHTKPSEHTSPVDSSEKPPLFPKIAINSTVINDAESTLPANTDQGPLVETRVDMTLIPKPQEEVITTTNTSGHSSTLSAASSDLDEALLSDMRGRCNETNESEPDMMLIPKPQEEVIATTNTSGHSSTPSAVSSDLDEALFSDMRERYNKINESEPDMMLSPKPQEEVTATINTSGHSTTPNAVHTDADDVFFADMRDRYNEMNERQKFLFKKGLLDSYMQAYDQPFAFPHCGEANNSNNNRVGDSEITVDSYIKQKKPVPPHIGLLTGLDKKTLRLFYELSTVVMAFGSSIPDTMPKEPGNYLTADHNSANVGVQRCAAAPQINQRRPSVEPIRSKIVRGIGRPCQIVQKITIPSSSDNTFLLPSRKPEDRVSNGSHRKILKIINATPASPNEVNVSTRRYILDGVRRFIPIKQNNNKCSSSSGHHSAVVVNKKVLAKRKCSPPNSMGDCAYDNLTGPKKICTNLPSTELSTSHQTQVVRPFDGGKLFPNNKTSSGAQLVKSSSSRNVYPINSYANTSGVSSNLAPAVGKVDGRFSGRGPIKLQNNKLRLIQNLNYHNQLRKVKNRSPSRPLQTKFNVYTGNGIGDNSVSSVSSVSNNENILNDQFDDHSHIYPDIDDYNA